MQTKLQEALKDVLIHHMDKTRGYYITIIIKETQYTAEKLKMINEMCDDVIKHLTSDSFEFSKVASFFELDENTYLYRLKSYSMNIRHLEELRNRDLEIYYDHIIKRLKEKNIFLYTDNTNYGASMEIVSTRDGNCIYNELHLLLKITLD